MEYFFESSIKGTFDGWRYGKKFELLNGDIWEQTSNHYSTYNIVHPIGRIIGTECGFEMEIIGVNDRILVRRIS